MKQLLFTFAVLGAVFSSWAQTPINGWNLSWSEEFNDKQLDTVIWSKIPRGTADWNNYMADYKELYQVRNGVLTLRGINNTKHKRDTAQFLTGGVYTYNKQTFENGRIEIRAKLDNAQGFWPAIWLLPQGLKWPKGGEIDIMEHLNHDSVVYQTIHSVYTLKHGIKDKPLYSVHPSFKYGDWNTYGVELYKDSLCFFVNDVKTHTYPRIETDIENQFPFADAPFYLLIDAQLGGSWVGKVDPKQLPVEMTIDWVRFYTKQE